jgi:hypothetical protein
MSDIKLSNGLGLVPVCSISSLNLGTKSSSDWVDLRETQRKVTIDVAV